jgi:AraC family transcriptional regulator
MQVARRTFFDGTLLQAIHARARPSPHRHGEIERQSVNILLLPLAGVFAMHDGPRKHVIATPHHAVFVAADRPCRMSLPAERAFGTTLEAGRDGSRPRGPVV